MSGPFSSSILYSKLFHFRRVLRTLNQNNLLTKIKTIKFRQRKVISSTTSGIRQKKGTCRRTRTLQIFTVRRPCWARLYQYKLMWTSIHDARSRPIWRSIKHPNFAGGDYRSAVQDSSKSPQLYKINTTHPKSNGNQFRLIIHNQNQKAYYFGSGCWAPDPLIIKLII